MVFFCFFFNPNLTRINSLINEKVPECCKRNVIRSQEGRGGIQYSLLCKYASQSWVVISFSVWRWGIAIHPPSTAYLRWGHMGLFFQLIWGNHNAFPRSCRRYSSKYIVQFKVLICHLRKKKKKSFNVTDLWFVSSTIWALTPFKYISSH